MKYVIIQGDGMGDIVPEPEGAATALEAARTPNLDRIAGAGLFGMITTIPADLPPGSDVGNLSLFGYDPHLYYTGRSPLEAAAMGIELGSDDVAFRMNLVTFRGAEGEEQMADFAGGHIDSESAAVLVGAVGEALGDQTFRFHAGVSYRHLMVWRDGAADMETTPPHDITDQAIGPFLPRGAGADELSRIMTASRKILADHPLNRQRVSAGQPAISQVWLWGQGRRPTIPSFASKYHLRGAAISAVDLVRGIAVFAGFDNIRVPGATGFLDTDYAAKGEYALRALDDHDLVFIHIEAPDEAGHMGDREEKIKAIEAIDEKIAGPLLERLPRLGPFKILVTSDHATPLALRTHRRDPVPFALATREQIAAGPTPRKYGEREAAGTGVTIETGHSIIARLLAWPE